MMKSMLFAAIASFLFLGNLLGASAPSEEAEDFAVADQSQRFGSDGDDFSEVAKKKKKGKGKKGKGKKGKGKGKKRSATEAEESLAGPLTAGLPVEPAMDVSDDETSMFCSDEDDSFVSAKKKGKGKKGKGKKKKGRKKKTTDGDDGQVFNVAAAQSLDAVMAPDEAYQRKAVQLAARI